MQLERTRSMTELTGTLEGVGLPALVRFLSGLHKSGCLRITHQDWRGEVFFQNGRVINASFGSTRGTAALDALVQALSGGAFAFDAEASPSEERNVDLEQAALQAHLDDLAARTVNGQASLPSLDAVPHLVSGDDERDDQLPLDRGMLQTLLMVDGQHSVREIVSERGTLDVLWQIANLVEVGLVRLERLRGSVAGGSGSTAPAPLRSGVSEPPHSIASEAPRRTVPEPPRAAAPEPIHTLAPEPAPAEPTTQRCPRLGFEDDPHTSFARPTRLHRCFASKLPLPLSLDQQRELCLSEHFDTCPRLANGVRRGNGAVARAAAANAPVMAAAATEDPRIVRLPFGSRNPSAARAANANPTATPASAQPRRLRAFVNAEAAEARLDAASAPQEAAIAQPTPVRARPQPNFDHATAPAADQHDSGAEAPSAEVPTRAVERLRDEAAGRMPLSRVLAREPRSVLIGAAAVVLVGLLALGVVLVRGGLLDPLAADDSLDPSQLPNASAVAAGTPIALLPNVNGRPTVTADRTVVGDTAPTAAPTAVATVVVPVNKGVLLDESFADNSHNWPNNPQGTAWVTGGAYRLATRQAGQFVAIAAPLPSAQNLQDVVVSATFHKVGGPPGGGYGIVVRDQAPESLDGSNQNGRYYVVEAGDKGEVGIWLRDNDHWVDLLPWQRSDAVRPGTAVNELTVRAVGDQLSLLVNGAQAATRTDATLKAGGAGLFVGGDGNQVSVDHVSIQTP
jgi:Domain of unknown function (DUF4388)